MDVEKQEKPKPCGVCLQHIHDLSNDSIIKIVVGQTRKGKILTETIEAKALAELFPFLYEKRQNCGS